MLKIKNIQFITSYAHNNDIEKDSKLPEIAFIGRSNVGKSSLLNDLSQRKISYTSQTPGKTQLINFFKVNEDFCFVDLPGYGYAKIPKSQKKEWGELIEVYLETRQQLKIILFLLDIRRIPNENDCVLNKWFRTLSNLEVIYVLTKADKLSKNEQEKQKTAIALELFVNKADFILYSVPKKIGRESILNKIENILLLDKK